MVKRCGHSNMCAVDFGGYKIIPYRSVPVPN